MLSASQDYTTQWTANNGNLRLDLSGWDYCVVQFESASGAINFNHTNDAGAVTGVTEGNALTSTGYQPVIATNMGSGATVTSAGSGSGLYRFSYIGRFLQLVGAGVTVSKLIVFQSKVG